MLRRTVPVARFNTTRPVLLLHASRLAFAKGASKPQRAPKTTKSPVAPPDAAPAPEDPCLVEVDVPQTKCAFDPNRPNSLDALAAQIKNNPARAACFRRHFYGQFEYSMEKHNSRAVLFLTGQNDLEKNEEPGHGYESEEYRFQASRFAAARKVAASLRSEWDPSWSKLLVITGPPRCGKTHVGLFGLANHRRLTIYIRTASLLQNVRGDDKVAECMAEGAVHQRIADDPATVDPWARDDAVWAARRYYKEALAQHLLDLVEERVGKRDSGALRAIFFFDDFDRGSEGVRRAVLDIASDMLDMFPTVLVKPLMDRFGFAPLGIVVAGTRLATAEGAIRDPQTQLTVSAIGVDRDDMDRVTEALLPLVQGPESSEEAAARCGLGEWSVFHREWAAAAEVKVRELSLSRFLNDTPTDANELASSLASFLCAVAEAGRDLPLAQFAAVLNDVFSPSTQFHGDVNGAVFQPVTVMRAPAGLEARTLSSVGAWCGGASHGWDGFCELPMSKAMVFHERNTADVQLVLCVRWGTHVSFNFRCFVPAVSDSSSDFLKDAHAQWHAQQQAAAMEGRREKLPPLGRDVRHHGGFIPVFGLRHGPCWMGNGWHVKIPGPE